MPRRWLITGASRGLGRAFAQAALEAGDTVVATARRPA
ncbi:MAG: SDR family NAD(P)-dependent oxidoreductase, partial [Solirubrobacteraceae bacterium]|nr:SDR family NAD(P)-dependent oxidoreductase [Solirubrobacteraceae bacterium]